jgi:NhaP-type Na+/H+ or K+/H+ antiporter
MNINILTVIFLSFLVFHMAPKLSHIFPESCLLIFVGVGIGLLLFHTDSVHVQTLTPKTFFFYMLPPIILDAGYFMPNRLFFNNLGTILLFAVIGTLWNTFSIGKSSNVLNIVDEMKRFNNLLSGSGLSFPSGYMYKYQYQKVP